MSRLSSGGVAAGAAIGRATVGGSTQAYLGDDVQVGQTAGQIVGGVSVTADSDISVFTEDIMVAGGIGAGAGNDARAVINPIIRASIGAGADVKVLGDIAVTSKSVANASARAVGIAMGGVAVGVSIAQATVTPNIQTFIGQNAIIDAGRDILVRSVHNFNLNGALIDKGARATANTPGGGVIAGNGAEATATASAIVETFVGAGAILDAGRDVVVTSRANNDADAEATGIAGGLVGVGAGVADAIAGGSTQAHMDGSIIDGRNLTVLARASTTADADTEAVSGGIVGVSGNDAGASISPTVIAFIGANADIVVTQDVAVTALSTGSAIAETSGVAGGVVGVGASKATATEITSVSAFVGSHARVDAGNNIAITAGHNYNLSTGQAIGGNWIEAIATSSSGGLVGVIGSEATAASTLNIGASLNNGSTLIGGNDVSVLSRSSSATRTNASSNTGGLVAEGQTVVSSTINNTNTVFTVAGALIEAIRNATFSAESTTNATADVTGGQGGLVSDASTKAKAAVMDRTQAEIGTGSDIFALDTLLVEALTSIDAHTTSTITSGGLVDINLTEADTDVNAATRTVIGQGAELDANTTKLHAKVTRLDADADAFSKTAIAGVADSQAHSFLDVISRTDVILETGADETGADVTGVDRIELISRQDGVDTDSNATARIEAGFTGTVEAITRNQFDLDSDINAKAGSALRTDDLLVEAESPKNADLIWGRDPDAEAGTVVQTIVETLRVVEDVVSKIPIIGWFVKQIVKFVTVVSQVVLHSDESEVLQGAFNSDNTVILDGDIFLGSVGEVEVEIDSGGNVKKAIGIDIDDVQVSGNQVVVGDIISDRTGRMTVDSRGGLLTGNATIHKGNNIDRVIITNQSGNDLVINDIQPVNPNVGDPDLVFTAAEDTSDFTIVGDSIDPPTIDIRNETASDVILAGRIFNPSGTTNVFNKEGDIRMLSGAFIQGNRASLTAVLGNIGSAGGRVNVQLFTDQTDGSLTATAGGDVYLSVGLFDIRETFPGSGTTITGDFDITAGGDVDIIGGRAQVLVASSNPADPLTPINVGGVYNLNDVSGANVKFDVTGDITIAGDVGATSGVATLDASGSILDAGGKVVGPAAVLIAGSSIGTSSDALDTGLGRLEAGAGAGGIRIDNMGDLTVGGIGGRVGLNTGGPIVVTSSGGITVEENVSSSSDVTLTAEDSAASGNDLLIANLAHVISLFGSVVLEAGDDLRVRAGGAVRASRNVRVRGERGNAGNADAGGSTIDLFGLLSGDTVTVEGGDDADTFNLRVVGPSGIALDAGGGNDTINVGSQAPGGGRVGGIAGALDIAGGLGADTLNVDDSGDVVNNGAVVTAASLTGLGLGSGITYGTLENLNIDLGIGNDSVRVKGVSANTTINMGGGADVIDVFNDGGLLEDIDNTLTVNGQGGGDTLNVVDSSDLDNETGTLSSQSITGLGMGGRIDYGAFETLNVTLGRGNDDFTVQSTTAGTVTTVDANLGGDSVRVGSSIEDVRGPLFLLGGGDAGDNLTLDDRSNTNNESGVIDGGQVTGFGMSTGDAITYGGFGNLQVLLANTNDSLTIVTRPR